MFWWNLFGWSCETPSIGSLVKDWYTTVQNLLQTCCVKNISENDFDHKILSHVCQKKLISKTEKKLTIMKRAAVQCSRPSPTVHCLRATGGFFWLPKFFVPMPSGDIQGWRKKPTSMPWYVYISRSRTVHCDKYPQSNHGWGLKNLAVNVPCRICGWDNELNQPRWLGRNLPKSTAFVTSHFACNFAACKRVSLSSGTGRVPS